jgi:FdhD protein
MTQADARSAAQCQAYRWRADGGSAPGERLLPVEAPVALVHDASTTAVMMATPADLEDFGIGFSITEGIVAGADEIQRLEVRETPAGFEVQMWLEPGRGHALAKRRRRLAGPTGCGLCGLESLAAAVPAPPVVSADLRLPPQDVQRALADLTEAQALNSATRAVHAAGYWTPGGGLQCVREDVGRHNALDKVVGHMARQLRRAPGVVLLTSRVSVEMVQKCAALGAPILAAVSAPTALAVQTAQAAGVTLIGIARSDGFEVFTHGHRVR